MFNSFPIAKLQTLPLTLGGMPCHHSSRTLREQHLFKVKHFILRNISLPDELQIYPLTTADGIQTKMNTIGPRSQIQFAYTHSLVQFCFELQRKSFFLPMQWLYIDRSTSTTIHIICSHTWLAKIKEKVNKWKGSSHLCHCLC